MKRAVAPLSGPLTTKGDVVEELDLVAAAKRAALVAALASS